MRVDDPPIQTVEVSEAPVQWEALVDRVSRRRARVIVERAGTPVAAIVSALDLEALRQLDAEREERWRVVDEIRARNPGMDPEEVERDVAEEIEAMRRERRAAGIVDPLE
jgi:prevent-host-death family protein